MAQTNVRGAQIADGANGVDLTVDVNNTLPVANGGTGRATLAIGALLVGNTTSGVTTVSPGSNGDVLQVVGGVWTSQAANTGTQRTFAYFMG